VAAVPGLVLHRGGDPALGPAALASAPTRQRILPRYVRLNVRLCGRNTGLAPAVDTVIRECLVTGNDVSESFTVSWVEIRDGDFKRWYD
jgi:hypothetical protein